MNNPLGETHPKFSPETLNAGQSERQVAGQKSLDVEIASTKTSVDVSQP